MHPLLRQLTPQQDLLAKRLLLLERRERILNLYNLLATARVAVSRAFLRVLEGAETKAARGASASTGAAKAKQRARSAQKRLEIARRYVLATDNARKRALVRRVVTHMKLLGEISHV